MQQGRTVTVYNFWLPSASQERREMSTFKATRTQIFEGHGGAVIESTAQPVLEDALDPQGHYHRVATGWGALA